MTVGDLDFDNRRIKIDHQLIRKIDGDYYIEKPKTKSGYRFIPMADDVYESLKNILCNRPKPKIEWEIDGYSDFILISSHGKIKLANSFRNYLNKLEKKFCDSHPEQTLPHLTPHVFRHTFCTRMANLGMDVKSLQYLMGHSNANITMNVYTHTTYDVAEKQFLNIANSPME